MGRGVSKKQNFKLYKMNKFYLLLFLFVIEPEILNAQPPIYNVKKTNATINIDGVLDEPDWVNADTTEHFVILGTTTVLPQTTTWAKMLWDNTYLYIGMYCEDKNIWATLTTHDAALYTEDVVEVYIDPDNDQQNYIEFELNPLNTVFDLWLNKPWNEGGVGHSEWNFDNFSTAIKIHGTVANNSDVDTSWTCEMALPFSEMQFIANTMHYPPYVNEFWRLNLYRFDRSPGVTEHEETGWSQTGGGQHVPDKFGIIWFKNSTSELAQSTVNSSSGTKLILSQNFPNPFKTSTSINYYILQPCIATLRIYDLSGRIVWSNSIKHLQVGNYSFTVNANSLSPGIYNYTLQEGSYISGSMKMAVMK